LNKGDFSCRSIHIEKSKSSQKRITVFYYTIILPIKEPAAIIEKI